ncbi:MAG: type II secretion system F family protein [Planctomycetes bacterium]|nr:type II secretion system F family protein [Planctomycetota bacterium]
MLWIGAHEAAALQFEDVASALEAGLPLQTLGGDPTAGERVLHHLLARRRVSLTPTEATVFEHAWRAGTAAQALRARAVERRQRAEFVRTLWAGLRYPLLLLTMVTALSFLLTPSFGPRLAASLVLAAVVAAAWLVRSSLRGGTPWVAELPGLGPTLREAGELPFLETLHALYGAGVPLLQAHTAALSTVAIPAVRDRLVIADRILQDGRPLHEALHTAVALHAETRQLLATGERAGQLEDALQRALARRRDVVSRRVLQQGRWIGHLTYVLAALAVAWFVLDFWSNHYRALTRLRR